MLAEELYLLDDITCVEIESYVSLQGHTTVGLPDFGKSFKSIVEPGFPHEFDHAEFNDAQKIRSKISRGRYFELKIWVFPYFWLKCGIIACSCPNGHIACLTIVL